MARFSLQVTFATGRKLMLAETYSSQHYANMAACNYIKDFSDPCGTGEKVAHVSTLDNELIPC